MKYNAKDFRRFKIYSLDEKVGLLHDFYFSNKDWKMRYILCDSGFSMLGRLVIFSTEAICKIDLENKIIVVNISLNEIENSPMIKPDHKISLKDQGRLHDYYNWQKYWMDKNTSNQSVDFSENNKSEERENNLVNIDGLNCTREILGLNIKANSSQIGILSNLLVNLKNWIIEYLVIDLESLDKSNNKFLVTPNKTKTIEPHSQKAQLKLTKEEVKNAPKIGSLNKFSKSFEKKLESYFG